MKKMEMSIFITAAPVGAVPRAVDVSEPVFIPACHIEIGAEVEREKFLADLKNHGWEMVDQGGVLFDNVDNSKKLLPASFLELLNDVALARRIVILLSALGWKVLEDGSIICQPSNFGAYLPPFLVSSIRKDNPRVVDCLLKDGWVLQGPGVWRSDAASTPYLPTTTDQIVQEVTRCASEGAAIIHLHTRYTDDLRKVKYPFLRRPISFSSQRNSIEVKQYDQLIPLLGLLGERPLLNLSTSVRGDAGASASGQRRAHLKKYDNEVTVDLASFSLAPVIFKDGNGYDNCPKFIHEQLTAFADSGVIPEIEVFNMSIVDNLLTVYKNMIEDVSGPTFIMLVGAVDQYRRDPITGALMDDSLIAPEICKRAAEQLKNGDDYSRIQAMGLFAEELRPIVKRLRDSLDDTLISLLLPGMFQSLLVDLALELQLDGIRVGLEDGLNVSDLNAVGGTRRAVGSFEQVAIVREELRSRGVTVLSATALREKISKYAAADGLRSFVVESV